MIKARIVRLKPNREQEKMFWQFSNTARFIYNECLAYKIKEYNNNKNNVSVQGCIEHIRKLKNTDEGSWIKLTPEAISKQAIKDLDVAFKNFYRKGYKGFPKFKSKNKTRPSFYQRTDRIRQLDDTHIKLTGIKESVKCNEIHLPSKVMNSRVFYDGKYWFLSYSFEYEPITSLLSDEVIGIDLGINKFAYCSNDMSFENINYSPKLVKLVRKRRRLQRRLSNKYKMNRLRNHSSNSENTRKLVKRIRVIDRTIKNVRDNYIHEITNTLVRTKPKAIVIEDLNVKGMMKGNLARSIQQQNFRKFRNVLEYKTKENGIEMVVADRFYPSSKICSCCGKMKKQLSLKEREYVCEYCGLRINRDYNASINLMNYYNK